MKCAISSVSYKKAEELKKKYGIDTYEVKIRNGGEDTWCDPKTDRIVCGYRTWTETYHCVDINSLEELSKFIKKVKHSVVVSRYDNRTAFDKTDMLKIEIYDDWME